MSAEKGVSLATLAEALKKNELGRLRELLESSERVVFAAYRLPRFKPLKVRSYNKSYVELDPGIYSRLEYSLFKAFIESAKNGKLPTFKEIADLASDYKAVAKYLITLSEYGLVVFPDPEKASRLAEAVRATSEGRYRRRISKVLDLHVVVNIKALEERASRLNCVYRNGKIICDYYSHDEEREQEKLQVKLFNEYLSASSG